MRDRIDKETGASPKAAHFRDRTMAESFFQRWNRRKAEALGVSEPSAAKSGADDPDAAGEDGKAGTKMQFPTLRDVASLTAESDYSVFVAKGVDKSVHRAAMKKLFADPHFNVMDGLDIYIDDYTKPSPLSAAMLAALEHAKTTLMPPGTKQSEEQEETADAADLESADNAATPMQEADAAVPSASAEHLFSDNESGLERESDPTADPSPPANLS